MGDGNLDIGRVFEQTFKVVGDRLVELVLLAIIFVAVPTLIVSWLTTQMIAGAVSSGEIGFGFQFNIFITNFIAGLLPLLLQAAVVYTTVEALAGRPTDTGSSVQVALGVFLPLLVVSILLSLGITIGFMLLIIPGLILLTVWAVVVPAFVIERPGIIGAFERSMQLTEGQRLRIFGLMLIALVVFIVVGVVISMLSFGVYTTSTDLESLTRFSLIGAIIESIIGGAAAVIGAVGVSVLYVQLRELKEGTSLDSLADIFS